MSLKFRRSQLLIALSILSILSIPQSFAQIGDTCNQISVNATGSREKKQLISTVRGSFAEEVFRALEPDFDLNDPEYLQNRCFRQPGSFGTPNSSSTQCYTHSISGLHSREVPNGLFCQYDSDRRFEEKFQCEAYQFFSAADEIKLPFVRVLSAKLSTITWERLPLVRNATISPDDGRFSLGCVQNSPREFPVCTLKIQGGIDIVYDILSPVLLPDSSHRTCQRLLQIN